MRCGNCGNNIPENNRYCEKCGWKIPEPEGEYRYCGRCGLQMPAEKESCPRCGMQFVQTPIATPPESNTVEPMNMKMVAVVIIALAVFVVGAIMISNMDKINTPTEHYTATYEVKIYNYYFEDVTITMELGSEKIVFENVKALDPVSHKFTIKWEGKDKQTKAVRAVYSAVGEKANKFVFKQLIFSPDAKGTYTFCINDQIISKEETIYVK